MKHIYIIGKLEEVNSSLRTVKIGISRHPEMRLSQVQTGSSEVYMFINCSLVQGADELEKAIHLLLQPHHVKGEWFKLPANILMATAKVMHSADMDCECSPCSGKSNRNIIQKHNILQTAI